MTLSVAVVLAAVVPQVAGLALAVAVLVVLAVGVLRRSRGPQEDDSDDVLVVPDAPPSAPGSDGSRVGRLVRARRDRRLERWRLRRRTEAAEADLPWDPHERPPWHVRGWGGAQGRTDIAADRFRALRDLHPTVEALHARRVPGRRSTIDHVFVGSAGVVVAGSRRWTGFVTVQRGRLVVAGRDRTRAVDVVTRQVAAVRDALEAEGYAGVPVRGVVHCVETENVLLDGTLGVGDVHLYDALGTLGLAVGDELLTYEGVRHLAVVLERRLPPA